MKKLFEIIFEKHLNIRKMFNELALFNDIDKSKGYLLDLLGGNFKVLRNGLSDEEYRRILKFEISLLQFLGSPEEIQRILSEYFKLNKEEFRIIELSAKILISIPEKLDKQEIFKVVRKIKAAGVGLEVKFGIYIEDYLISELHEMTLEEKLAAIDVAMAAATARRQSQRGAEGAPIDPAELTICEGCE